MFDHNIEQLALSHGDEQFKVTKQASKISDAY